jgi:signal transduction histidine kinase
MGTGSDEFDDVLAEELAEAWSHLRVGLVATCGALDAERRRLTEWSGRARLAWDDALRRAVRDVRHVAHDVATTIDDLVERHDRWVSDTRRMDGTGR